MGVRGLWRLLLPIGRRISIETLEGKVLAVDASIWLTQFLKANRDPDTGKVRPGAHLQGFLRRICKLLYHGVRPVFVFDGATPEIKLREIRARRRRRERSGMGVFGIAEDGEEGDVESSAAVRRMAKKILVAELRKAKELGQAAVARKKKGNGGEGEETKKESEEASAEGSGAFSAGFNLVGEGKGNGADEDDDDGNGRKEGKSVAGRAALESKTSSDCIGRENEGSDEDLPEFGFEDDSRPSFRSEGLRRMASAQATQEAIDVDALEAVADDVKMSDKAHNDAPKSDWDVAAPSREEAENERGSPASSSSSDSSVDIPEDENDIDLDSASLLPSSSRSAVIEKARRQQRMRSRKEFMSVAGDPSEYSSTQVRNFLRSCNLNKKVHEIGTRAAKRENKRGGGTGDSAGSDDDELGECIASDAGRRFVFVKDKDIGSNKLTEKEKTPSRRRVEYSRVPSSREGTAGRRRLRRRTAGEAGGDWSDEEDDLFSGDEDNRNPEQRKVLDISSSEEDSDSVGGPGGFLPGVSGGREAGGFLPDKDSSDKGRSFLQNALDGKKTETDAEDEIRSNVERFENSRIGGMLTIDDNSSDEGEKMDGFNANEGNDDSHQKSHNTATGSSAYKSSRREKIVNATSKYGRNQPPPKTDPIALEDDSEAESANAGGFMADDRKQPADQSGGSGLIYLNHSDSTDNQEHDDAFNHNDGEQGDSKRRSQQRNRENEQGEDETHQLRAAQVLEDEMLARALQEAEQEESLPKASSRGVDRIAAEGNNTPAGKGDTHGSSSDEVDWEDGDNSEDGVQCLESKCLGQASIPITGSKEEPYSTKMSSDSFVGVDWEDCEEKETLIKCTRRKVGTQKEQVSAEEVVGDVNMDGSDSDSIDWEDGEPPVRTESSPSEERLVGQAESEENCHFRDENSDDNIEWEDGESDSKEEGEHEYSPVADAPLDAQNREKDGAIKYHKSSKSRSGDAEHMTLSSGHRVTSNNTTVESERISSNESPKDLKETMHNNDSSGDIFTAKGLTSSRMTSNSTTESSSSERIDVGKDDDANAAALRRAMGAAAHLTDWAGRAVRGAIAAHMDVAETSAGHSTEVGGEKTEENGYLVADTGGGVSDIAVAPAKNIEGTPSDSFPNSSLNSTSTFPSSNRSVGKVDSLVSSPGPSRATDHRNVSLSELQDQYDLMQQEENKRQRDMDGMTDEMKEDIVQLLQLFGVPYVESPAEAEAQCATLEELGLVDGVVTEDSDIFVFGGKNVYKNIFESQKYVEVYLSRDAEKEIGLTRERIIALAMLLGGDYTDGVKGVGIVNGMEILEAFFASADSLDNAEIGLKAFRKWLEGFDPSLEVRDAGKVANAAKSKKTSEELFHLKHRSARMRWIVPTDFPAPNVLNAYRNPVVDTSRARFSWGIPDVESLRTFCHNKLGWSTEETDGAVVPVVKQMERMQQSGHRQTRLESYFMKYEDNIKFAEVRSKRLRSVLGNVRDDSNTEGLENQKKGRARRSSRSKKKPGAKRKRSEAAKGPSLKNLYDIRVY